MKYTTYKSQAGKDVLYILISCAVILCAAMTGIPIALKVILYVLAGIVIVMSVWSICSKRSITAIILFYVFKMMPIKDRRDPAVFDAYMKSSSEEYRLSEKTVRKYNIKKLDDYTDTYVIDHQQSPDDLVIFYIHGGGYWVRPYGIHFTMFNKLAEMLHAKIIIPVYPLAPAHNAVEANEMVYERYMHLLNVNKVDPQKVIFMGDSAGGGLAMSLMLQLKEKGDPLPREGIFYSPWVDATNSTPGMDKIPDPFLNLPNLTYGGEVYAGDLPGGPANVLCSPINGDLKGLPKMTAFGGTYDSLNLDAERMADVAAAQGADYTIYVYPKMVHGYAGFFFTPEAKYAIRQVDNVVNGRPVENVVGKR